jgi:hypothetical protein
MVFVNNWLRHSKVDQGVTLLIFIREVIGSNLSRDTGYAA